MSVGRGEKTKEIQKLPASKLGGGISVLQHGDGWSKPRGIDPAPILSKMREKKHPGWMPHSCLLPELSKATSACSETLKTSLYFFFCFYFCPYTVYAKETLKRTWRNDTGLKQLFLFPPPTPLLLCVKETRLPNDAENSH